MKNLAIVFAFFGIAFFNSDAMKSEQFNCKQEGVSSVKKERVPSVKQEDTSGVKQEGIPIVLYKVNVQPPVEVLQIPSEKIIQLGGIISKSIRIDCKEYNGIRMRAPINIRYDMTKEELGQSLCSAFGVDSVAFGEGHMSKNLYSKMFGCLGINW